MQACPLDQSWLYGPWTSLFIDRGKMAYL